MKKQLVLFIGSMDEYESFIALNPKEYSQYYGHRNNSELLRGFKDNLILITKFGRDEMSREFELILKTITVFNTIIYL